MILCMLMWYITFFYLKWWWCKCEVKFPSCLSTPGEPVIIKGCSLGCSEIDSRFGYRVHRGRKNTWEELAYKAQVVVLSQMQVQALGRMKVHKKELQWLGGLIVVHQSLLAQSPRVSTSLTTAEYLPQVWDNLQKLRSKVFEHAKHHHCY